MSTSMERNPARLADFLILGFPKCGTSALARSLETLDGVAVDRFGADIEAPYFTSDDHLERLRALRREAPAGEVVGHKCTAYLYNPSAWRRLVATGEDPLLIACVREPVRALVSWREMHRRIAVQGSAMGHFVNKDEQTRAFYAEATLEDYYHEYARQRLNYESHMRRAHRACQSLRWAVVSQEFMARSSSAVIGTLAGLIGARPPAPGATKAAHTGFADRNAPQGLSAASLAELDEQNRLLRALLDEWRGTERITVIADDGDIAP